MKLPRVDPVPGRTGDVVSILSGTGAGQWRRVLQRIESTVYLLDKPLPTGSDILSISPGFVNDVYAGNVIDAPNSFGAAGFVLAGNHFGTIVKNNRVLGVGEAFTILAMASETPSIWGWSHVPIFGLAFEGNHIEDSPRGAILSVFHNEYSKSNKGRVYMTVSLKGNTVRWSNAFLRARRLPGARGTTAGITLGMPGSIDPGELVADESDDQLTATVQRGLPLP